MSRRQQVKILQRRLRLLGEVCAELEDQVRLLQALADARAEHVALLEAIAVRQTRLESRRRLRAALVADRLIHPDPSAS